MRKIPTIFERPWDDPDPRARALVTRTPNPLAAWVFEGEGTATEKVDGTAVLITIDGPYKRHEIKKGKPSPEGFVAADDVDPETGKQPGWLPVDFQDPADKWHVEALYNDQHALGGSFELVGPKVQSDPYKLAEHHLWMHGGNPVTAPTSFDDLKEWLADHYLEGIVWHHPDGRMAKIKRRDFGLQWP